MSRRGAVRQPEAPPLAPLPPPTAALSRAWQIALACAVFAYTGLACGHAITTLVLPRDAGSLINAPDESAHLGYIRLLVEQDRIPTRDDSPLTYEWHQPPVYYAAAAPFYAAGGATAVRVFTALCGAASILLIFAAARRVFPSEPALAVLAAGIAAMLPMRQAVYAAVGNDAMLELWFSAALYQTVHAFTNGLSPRRACLIGLMIALAILTKATGALLAPLTVFALFLLWRNGETTRSVAVGGVYLFGVVVLCTAGWYARNWSLYHELTPVKSFIHEFEHTAKASDFIGQPIDVDVITGSLRTDGEMTRLGYLRLVAQWTFRTFAGAYTTARGAANGVPTFLAPPFYLAYTLLFGAGIAGLVRLHFRARGDFTLLQRSVIGLFWVVFLLVLASFGGFVWVFFQAQGRYLYPAMLPISVLTSLGVRGLLPVALRDRATAGILATLFLLSVAFLFVVA